MTRLPRPVLAALLALSPVVAHAQAHPLAGKWTIEYAGGMRIENGEEHTTTAISTWILKVDGDVMTGTLGRELEGMDMEMPPPQPVTGRRAP